MFEFFPKDNK